MAKEKVRGIKTSDWYPSHPEFQYPKEFVNWVDSINSGWQNKIKYKAFDLYCEQAREWLEDNTIITDLQTEEDQWHWLAIEIQKCKDNTLYFCNKYGWIKEDRRV